MSATGARLGPEETSETVANALTVEDLSVEFLTEHGWVRVVDTVSFTLAAGETLGLVGESGSGKSVTSLAAMGLIPSPPGRVASGSVRLGDRELVGLPQRELEDVRGEDIAMVFQEPMTSLNPAYTVGEQIAEVVRRHRGVSRRAAWARAVEVLEQVGIPSAGRRARSYPHEFSGGMRQRVVIAIAICCDPSVLIADEPTTALDVTVQAQVLELLREMRAELGMAMLFITHDLGVIADVADRVIVMYAGQVAERAAIDELYRTPRHPYTEGLLIAMPQLGERTGRLASIPGRPEPPGTVQEGCRFRYRCPYARPRCAEDVPLIGVGPGRESRCIRVDEIEFRGMA